MDYELKCTKCRSIEKDTAFRCAKCNSILEVVYKQKPRAIRKSNLGKPLSRYLDFLPIKQLGVSFGEGKTPLIKIMESGLKFNLFLKLETENPTKTFKDRGSAIEISKAKEMKVKQVCCASTGNMGLSVARYSKKAHMRCTIFISENGNKKKIDKIRKQGAKIVMVKGDFNKALLAAEGFSKKTGAFVCGDYHFRKEGQKTLGYELVEQFGNSKPDYVFLPVGNGTLFAGLYKGLGEFKALGKIASLPRLVAVQSEKCDPIVRANLTGKQIRHVGANTKADAIAVGFPTFGFETLAAIESTNGTAIAVGEGEIESAVVELEDHDIYAELGGGTGYAGLLKYNKEHPELLGGKNVVVIITGNNEGKFDPKQDR